MKTFMKLTASSMFWSIPVLAMFLVCPTGVRAQVLIVDCTGVNTSAYPSITAALPNSTPGHQNE